ncbi:unnamed protein product [Parnassius mnemosyne]|uniref:Pupal cuticle protein 36-like n=1 Tax=Parnassius mnemosyne TaxID=213953 RepID=A0AAV1KNM8_9NEOP
MQFVVAAVLGVCSAARLDNTYLPPRGGAGSGFGGSSGFGGASGAFGASGAGGFGSGGSAGGFGGAGGYRGAGGSGAFGGAGGAGAYSGAGGSGAYSGAGGSGAYGGAGGSGAYSASGNYRQSADANAQILRLNSDVTAEGFSYDFETSNGIRADASGVATNGVQSQGSFAYKGDDGQDYSITYTADENGFQPRGAHLPTPPPIPEAILKSLEQNARDEAAGIVDDGFGAGGAGAGSAGFGAGGSGFGASGSGFGSGGSSFGAKGSGFNAATSRQYLAPNAGPRGSGNGNFNSQTGYRY